MSGDQMTDLRRAVTRAKDPDPVFLDRLYGELAAELGFREREGAPHARRRRTARWWLLAAAMLALTLAGSALIAGAAVRLLDRDADVLDAIRRAGAMQVLVRDGYPQARSPQGGANGFDTDVAAEVARRLGVTADTIAIADDQTIEDLDFRVDDARLVSMSSSALRFDAERDLRSRPIYYWPIAVLVPADSDIVSLDELDGMAICVVEGTSGEAWLAGTTDDAGITFTHGPPAAAAVIRTDDESCLDALADGTAAAVVPADLGPADLAVRGGIRALPGVAITEERSLFVDRDAGDAAALLTELDAAIEAARADGTLADLARSRFGGYDLSAPPSATPKEE